MVQNSKFIVFYLYFVLQNHECNEVDNDFQILNEPFCNGAHGFSSH